MSTDLVDFCSLYYPVLLQWSHFTSEIISLRLHIQDSGMCHKKAWYCSDYIHYVQKFSFLPALAQIETNQISPITHDFSHGSLAEISATDNISLFYTVSS